MKRMLIVEDDVITQNVMRKIFQSDYQIDLCESAEEYYDKHSSTKYDIIIMDISIKGNKHGLDLMKEIKESPTYDGIPIICLTAHAQMKTRQAAMESGADLFLTKPVFNKMLKEAVTALIMREEEKAEGINRKNS
ncbi:MAG: response regulator [Ignavibacteriaceae bacterium]|jgi:CheY-like chemotaxis protein|nr:response regulator [Ignavibacteriaceae bacterium]